MHIYILHSKLFGTPRIITSSFPIAKKMVELIANHGEYENYPDENKWKLQDIPYYPALPAAYQVDYDRAEEMRKEFFG